MTIVTSSPVVKPWLPLVVNVATLLDLEISEIVNSVGAAPGTSYCLLVEMNRLLADDGSTTSLITYEPLSSYALLPTTFKNWVAPVGLGKIGLPCPSTGRLVSGKILPLTPSSAGVAPPAAVLPRAPEATTVAEPSPVIGLSVVNVPVIASIITYSVWTYRINALA